METDYFDIEGLQSRGRIADTAPVQSTQWARPEEAWAEQNRTGEWVVKWRGQKGTVRAGASQDSILAQFMSLESAPPDDVARFVAKWGPLGLCGHGVPKTHLPRRMWKDLDGLGVTPCEVVRARPAGEIGERLDRWHVFAGQVHALHRVARLTEAGTQIPDEIWTKLEELGPPHLFSERHDESDPPKRILSWTGRHDENDEQRFIANALQQWLNFGDVGMHVAWEDDRRTIRYGGTGLAGAIALQLALTSTSTGSFYICSECAIPFTPERRPRSGQNQYCEDCRDAGVPARNRARAYRARKRAQTP